MNIILGSGSLRRKSILEEIFDRFQIIIPSIDEMKFKDEMPYDYVERITNSKMDSILELILESILESAKKTEASRTPEAGGRNILSILESTKSDDFFVITSDTIVYIEANDENDEKILGKPGSRDEAFSMLKLLSGREHLVITGICIILKNNIEIKRLYDYEKTSVKFKELSDKSIDFYLSCADYEDKAGSYAIQEYGEQIIDKVNGSVTNVIGFPLTLFFKMVNQIGGQDILFKR